MSLIREENEMSVRLHEWINGGEVVIALQPGQILRWRRGGLTDEGCFFEDHVWRYDQEESVIYREYHETGRDCDGPHEWHSECCLPVSEVVPHTCPRDLPWRGVDQWQRDVYAEMAGY